MQIADLPPPSGPHVLHSSRLVIDLSRVSDQTECVVYRDYSPVCFHNLRASVEKTLLSSTWSSFPSVALGTSESVGAGEYLLQVEVSLDALPPDASGPGWSAGAKSRFRLLRDGKVLSEETLASRSRAEFAYGAPLGEGASEVVAATALHIASSVSNVPETLQVEPRALPAVASQAVVANKAAPPAAELAKTGEPEKR